MKKKSPLPSRRSIGILAAVGVLIVVLVFVQHDQQTRLVPGVSKEKVYMNPELGFAIKVPKEWGDPKQFESDRTRELRFAHSLTIVVGPHFSSKLERYLTPAEATQNMFPNGKAEDIVFNGFKAKKIYTQPENIKDSPYVILLQQPNKDPTSMVILYVEPTEYTDKAVSTFTFMRV